MNPALLTINAGSSSIKAGLFVLEDGRLRHRQSSLVEGIGPDADAPDHAKALDQALSQLRAAEPDARIVAVGHRIVHGGTAFTAPVFIDDAALSGMQALCPLAPLHQPHNLAGVRATRRAFPEVPQIACFDTAFHSTMPEVYRRFALPARWADAGVRRYGFHGLSYESIRAQLSSGERDGLPARVIVAHLGNGASMCAMRDGTAVNTTMSFSPLDGMTMGTRCGRIDAAVVLHLIEHHGLSTAEVGDLLFRHSGLLGLSGLSADMRRLLASDAPSAAQAVEHFVESAARELAVMAAALRGLDMLVFTGGIGENAAVIRGRIVQAAAWLGLRVDDEANRLHARDIGAPGAAVRLRVLKTDEESVIASHTARAAGLDLRV